MPTMKQPHELVARHISSFDDHAFLLGPRGTGKTWLMRMRHPDAVFIDLLDPETLRALAARPERLRELIDAHPACTHVVIDEVQKLPMLLEVVHLLIEEHRGFRFILTGSSARSLRRGGVNLLGGRAMQLSLHPFMASELGARFRLDDALRFGMLPIVHAARSPEERVRGYNALYLREEVQMEGLVRNLGGFSRFLEAISFSQASVLNLANVARECDVNRKTVEGYLDVLTDLLLAIRLPVFSRRAQRALVGHPKFFFFDVGVFRANRPSGPLDAPSEIDGAALETLVAQHLHAWCAYSPGNHGLSYWRTRSGVEVDFVVYGSREFHALEVKNTAVLRPADFRGLASFAADYPQATCWLLYRGRERLLRDGVLCVPVEEFLLKLVPGAFPR